jgi:hypothetical protein
MNVIKSSSVFLFAFVGFAGPAALAQEYPRETQLRFEVWNGSSWTSQVEARPGAQVEFRMVVSYTGSNTQIRAFGSSRYQPLIQNWDNDGPSRDALGAWRNGGASGDYMPGNTMLSAAEGQSGAALTSYGRVGFGYYGQVSQFLNVLTSFYHNNGAAGAPDGSWLRIAGSFVNQWPRSGTEEDWASNDANRILRGVASTQTNQILASGSVNPYWTDGTQDIVLFRQAIVLSTDSTARSLSITTDPSSFLRASNLDEDNRRYFLWQTFQDAANFGSYRTSVDIVPAEVRVNPIIPAPSASLIGTGAILLTGRGRRRGIS